MIGFSKHDIDLALATRAHSGTSYVPETRGKQEQNSYVNHIQHTIDEFEQWLTDKNKSAMTNDLADYRRGYVKHLIALLSARTHTVSQMIVGAGGWTSATVRRNQKRNQTVDNRLSELINWSNKTLSRLRTKYDPARTARAPIRSDDSDAIDKLQEKIDKATKLQVFMKSANRICRNKRLDDEQKVTALAELGIIERVASELLLPDFAGRVGYAPYKLSNNSASISRMKKRIKALETEAIHLTKQPVEYEYVLGGVRVIESSTDYRIQVYITKEQVGIRKALKAHGFKWAPSIEGKPWQRLLNNAARKAVRDILID